MHKKAKPTLTDWSDVNNAMAVFVCGGGDVNKVDLDGHSIFTSA